MQQSDFKHDIS
nr:hypothetical protein [Tanacetum cinerariifolium]